MVASRPAATVVGMPWSLAAGMKCVPISPLVVIPQIAKLAASSQNAGTRAPRSSPSNAAWKLDAGTATGTVAAWPAEIAPYGVKPLSCGWFRMNTTTSGTTLSAAAATISDAQRQPWRVVTSATTGRKISCPVALAAVSTPVTNPRRASNQRFATVATKPIEIAPVPTPTSTPHSNTSCQLAVIVTLSAEPAAINASAAVSTLRTPRRSINAAANGAVSPKSVMLTDIASPTTPCDQPNSWCRGFIITPGTDRKPAAPRIATKLTAATTQAQWIRVPGVRVPAAVSVTRPLSPTGP